MPNKLGFIYYRYPYGMENEGVIEEGVDYVDFTVHHLNSLEARAKKQWTGCTGYILNQHQKPSIVLSVIMSRCAMREKNRKQRTLRSEEPISTRRLV